MTACGPCSQARLATRKAGEGLRNKTQQDLRRKNMYDARWRQMHGDFLVRPHPPNPKSTLLSLGVFLGEPV